MRRWRRNSSNGSIIEFNIFVALFAAVAVAMAVAVVAMLVALGGSVDVLRRG